jgi:hypothetical protein
MNGVYIVIQEGSDGYAVISAFEHRDDAFRAASKLREEHGTSGGDFKVKWVELE